MQNSGVELIEILERVKELVLIKDTDLLWSRFECVAEIIKELDSHLENCRDGVGLDGESLELLFGPTGALQEISINSGWGEEFLVLAAKFDAVKNRLCSK